MSRKQAWNLIIGTAFVVGDLSGKLVLTGTSSGPPLAALRNSCTCCQCCAPEAP